METAEITQRGKEAASGGARQARDRMADMLSDRSTRAAESSRGMAQDAGAVGEELRRRGRDRAADLADAAASRVERMSDYLECSDGSTIMEDATRYGRRHPAAVAMAGFAAGLAAARFVKAGDHSPRSPQGDGRREGIMDPQQSGALSSGAAGRGDAVRPAGSPS